MSDLAAALMIAIRVHAGQVDKQGEPYLLHVLRVVEAVHDDAKIVAALHDAIEDGPEDAARVVFHNGCLDDDEAQAIGLLTRGGREAGESYADYIAAIRDGEDRAHRLARAVKLADLRDNLGRIPADTCKACEGTGRESIPARMVASPTRFSEIACEECHGSMVDPEAPGWDSLKARYEKAIAVLEAGGEKPE